MKWLSARSGQPGRSCAFISGSCLLLALALLICTRQAAAQTPGTAVAKAVSVQGTVETQRSGQSVWRDVKLNDTFVPGDAIRVGERSRADIGLLDQSVLRLNAGTTIKVEAPRQGKTGLIDMIRGAAHFFSRGPDSLEVNTPFTVAGVRGTEFYIRLEPQSTLLTVFEGTVVAQNAAGSLTLNDGQSAIAEAGKAPAVRVVARPRDAVHWTLFYPPVIQDRQAPTYRAQSLLAVGAVDEARGELERVRQSSPGNADALSLLSIMALVQGDKVQAQQLALGAVAAQPNSASALLARSYSEQANLDLAAARASVQHAVDADPDNALAWARLAELHSSFGEADQSAAAAERAVALQPDLSRTQTVLGFAQLTAIRVDQARASFEKAITLDQADPLPRLGLGLAKIRAGDLDAGSREIEVAASLDPGNALVRSYLGKAYYEEKRSPRDQREFGVAKQLDPKDPTAWFYDAIAKQTSNRPVEALQDVETAIALNDNRAVYRSQLLLDSDAAARGASLGRIYSDLGFEGLALAEGWKSTNLDPTNASAHRLLADSYSALPRHQIARVSELLQSQLLQPINATPIQPRLAESNLGLVSSGGPGALSFNEFNPLFSRDGLSFLASGVAGDNDTRGAEAVVAGIYGRTAFSVGITDFKTDGWRLNAGQDDRIANAFVQTDLTPQTMLQAEVRYRDRMLGDPELRFFAEDVIANQTQTQKQSTYRLGLRHVITPNSTLLASLIHQRAEVFLRDRPDDFFIQFDQDFPRIRSTGGELQHLYRSGAINLTSGVGHVTTRAPQTFNLGFAPPFDFLNESTLSEEGNKSSNAYVYANINTAKDLSFTLGMSYDKYKPDNIQTSEQRGQFNPKLGVTWSPVAGTTIRAAAFRVLTRSLITDQTLEPTQVAGFNQFYDDAGATDSRRYGVAIDQKFSRTLYGGIELSRRNLSIPFRDVQIDAFGNVTSDQVLRGDSKEQGGRVYLFWTPHSRVALSAEYQHERFTNEDTVAFSFRNVKTDRIPLGVRYFHPSGFGLSLRGTHVRQSGEFRRLATGMFEPGRDSFFIVDAALTYRLPNRNGFISAGVTNLTDRRFRYQDTDPSNASIQPKRSAFVRVTLAF